MPSLGQACWTTWPSNADNGRPRRVGCLSRHSLSPVIPCAWGEQMGIFNRDHSTEQSSQGRAAIAWQLLDDGASLELGNVPPGIVDAILTASQTPNKNARVHVALTYTAAGTIEAYWDGQLVGEVSGPEVRNYLDALQFLASTGRYAVVNLTVPSRKSKGYGSALLQMPWHGNVMVPFNQPPPDFKVAPLRVSPSLKNEHLHVRDLERIAPAHMTPGWFVLIETANGGVDAYAPVFGRSGLGTKVGAVYKEDVPQTVEQLAGEPRAVVGRVFWYDRGPQIRLGY